MTDQRPHFLRAPISREARELETLTAALETRVFYAVDAQQRDLVKPRHSGRMFDTGEPVAHGLQEVMNQFRARLASC